MLATSSVSSFTPENSNHVQMKKGLGCSTKAAHLLTLSYLRLWLEACTLGVGSPALPTHVLHCCSTGVSREGSIGRAVTKNSTTFTSAHLLCLDLFLFFLKVKIWASFVQVLSGAQNKFNQTWAFCFPLKQNKHNNHTEHHCAKCRGTQSHITRKTVNQMALA